MDKISIVTVTYNCKNDVEKTIKSVLDLDYPNIEYIVIDGASKDGTVDIIKTYTDRIDYWISEPDKGIYDAMNKGIAAATGEWIIFMNAGDWFYRNTVLTNFFAQVNSDTTIAYGDIMIVGEHFQYHLVPPPMNRMTTQMVVKHQATFVRLKYHKQHLFDITYKSSGDYAFFYRACYGDKVKFQYVPVCVANFNNYGTSNVNFRTSFRENRRIWGKTRDYCFILKQEIMFVLWDMNRWLKNHLMSEKAKIDHEKNKASRKGTVYELHENIDI